MSKSEPLEYPFLMWKFKQAHRRFWENEANVRSFLGGISEYVFTDVDWLKQDLEIEQDSDWLIVSADQVRERGGAYFIQKYGGWMPILFKYFPCLNIYVLFCNSKLCKILTCELQRI